LDVQENPNAKKQDYWLGGTITTTNARDKALYSSL
jgi:hypothetical protein